MELRIKYFDDMIDQDVYVGIVIIKLIEKG